MTALTLPADVRSAVSFEAYRDRTPLLTIMTARPSLLYLSRTTPEAGRRYTDSGQAHDEKGLKHRPEDEVRPVPIPPELVEILCWHIDQFGVGGDGRLFRQPNGNIVRTSTYSQVWRAARCLALVPDQVASPLAGRPYDLRHAAVSLWLNAGVPAPRWRAGLVIPWTCSCACMPTASTVTRRSPTSASAVPWRDPGHGRSHLQRCPSRHPAYIPRPPADDRFRWPTAAHLQMDGKAPSVRSRMSGAVVTGERRVWDSNPR